MLEKELGRAAFHIHTTASDGQKTPEECLELASAAKINNLVIADHDTLSGVFLALETAERRGTLVSVVPAMEVSTAQGHLVAVFVNKEIPMFKPLDETVDIIHAQGGLAIVPHVGWGIPPASIAPETIDNLYQKGGKLDGVEVMNPYYKERHRRQALALGLKYDLALFGADDEHHGNLGRNFLTLFPGRTPADLRCAIEKRETIAVRSNLLPLEVSPKERISQLIKGLICGLSRKIIFSPYLISTLVSLRLGDLKKMLYG